MAEPARPGDGSADVAASTLSPAEFLLTADAGFEPAGFVMGSAVCHIGLPGSVAQRGGIAYAYTSVGELTMVSEAVRVAKDAATERLTSDARRLGADGVAGVRLTVQPAPWARDAIEIVVTGTALRSSADRRRAADSSPACRAPDGQPFISSLSGQDLRTLLTSGHRPAGIVLGCCVYRAVADNDAYNRWLGNRELTKLTSALSTARERAMLRMQDDAVRLAATGVVGVQLDLLRWREQERIIECRAVGTAIVPLEGAPPHRPAGPVGIVAV